MNNEPVEVAKLSRRFEFLRELGVELDFSEHGDLRLPRLRVLASKMDRLLTDCAGLAVLSPVFEIKVGLGMISFDIATCRQELNARLLQVGLEEIRRQSRDPVSEGGEWLTPKRLLEEGVRPVLAEAVGVRDRSNPMSDWTTRFMLETRVIPRLEAWTRALERLAGDFPEYWDHVGVMGDRDSRYRTFDNERSYRVRDRDLPTVMQPSATHLELVAQLRTQRDELDAIETFARALAAIPDLNDDEVRALALVVADEARHALLGEVALAGMGYDPTQIPIGTIGALLRRGLSAADSLRQISVVGEAGNVAAILRAAKVADEIGHPAVGAMLRHIHRDERFHLQFGHRLIGDLYPLQSASERTKAAFDQTAAYLEARGITGFSPADLATILGE